MVMDRCVYVCASRCSPSSPPSIDPMKLPHIIVSTLCDLLTITPTVHRTLTTVTVIAPTMVLVTMTLAAWKALAVAMTITSCCLMVKVVGVIEEGPPGALLPPPLSRQC